MSVESICKMPVCQVLSIFKPRTTKELAVAGLILTFGVFSTPGAIGCGSCYTIYKIIDNQIEKYNIRKENELKRIFYDKLISIKKEFIETGQSEQPQTSVIEKFKKIWQESPLSVKGEFISFCNSENTEDCLVRKVLSPVIYNNGTWKTSEEISSELKSELAAPFNITNINLISRASLFHATQTEDRLMKILKTKGVKNFSKITSSYNAVFASTYPEFYNYGLFVLGFTPDIHYSSKPKVKYAERGWIGFSKEIPVNKKTLAFIINASPELDQQSQERFQKKCNENFGAEVPVIFFPSWRQSSAENDALHAIGKKRGLPAEWSEVPGFSDF